MNESSDLIPDKFYTMSFDLQPDDQVIKKRSANRFNDFSSDQEFTLHPKPGTILTVDLNSTSLKLPVVGGLDPILRLLDNLI
ncbi:MAG: hypothetical protein CM15mP102_18320 [Flavobacteriales bacterium]|nr:MAG: hypothetical protein CM15mP102_18320 [Flavobacteriales bacterium]